MNVESKFKFLGKMIPYKNLRDTLTWGGFYVDNSKRYRRPRFLHPGPCPFCGMAIQDNPEIHMSAIYLKEDGHRNEYIVIQNNNPIVKNQLLIFPAPIPNKDGFLDHRIDINVSDVALIAQLTSNGFSNLHCTSFRKHLPLVNANYINELEIPFSKAWAVYVNSFPGTGRSVPHLHINCVPADYVPLPRAAPVAWQISQDAKNRTTISRITGLNIYGLTFEEVRAMAVANTLVRFHNEMNKWEIPYNIISYTLESPNSDSKHRWSMIVVPRDQEYCEAADQRVAGLEFLTGILMPGRNRLGFMDTIQRDLAFSQASLKYERRLKFERLLRGTFGMPPVGDAVYSLSNDQSYTSEFAPKYMPKVQRNLVFEDSDLPQNWQLIHEEDRTDANEIHHIRRYYEAGDDEKILSMPNVLVRITHASVCQSDRRVMLGNKDSSLNKKPLIIGHEGGGYIVDPGPWIGELQAGQKAVILPHLTCGKCDACRSYRQNLCQRMKHLGFHLNGSMAQLMSFPYQCILPIPSSFPDDALTLVEPLACILRALFRIKDRLAILSDRTTTSDFSPHTVAIYGAGPMGCLAARAFKRFWPSVGVKMVEPLEARRLVVHECDIADDIVPEASKNEQYFISFVASSELKASMDAIEGTLHGGTIVLFSGINTDDISIDNKEKHADAVIIESIHRKELADTRDDLLKKRSRLIGSSGYNYDDAVRSVSELHNYYKHYARIQNVCINGLAATHAHYYIPNRYKHAFHSEIAVESLLSPIGIYDKQDGQAIARALKILIRI